MNDSEDKMAGGFIGRLRVLMQGFTEKGFAQLVGLKRPALRSYLNGSKPSFLALIAISTKTNTSIDWLMTGHGEMHKEKEVVFSQAMGSGGRVDGHAPSGRVAPSPQPQMDADPAFARGYAEEVERLKAQLFLGAQREIEAGKREVEAGKREVGLLKEMAALKEIKQLPPPPTAGGGVADITLLGLAECGFAGWLLKKPLSVNVICPVGMNPAEDFAVMATGQSLFYAGIEPGFVCFCATKSTPRVGDIVYVLKPNNMASLGVVRELEQKEKGSETPWLVLQKWHDLDPKTGLREPYTLRENRDELEEIVPVIYVQRRPI